jgi:hypothetical protein
MNQSLQDRSSAAITALTSASVIAGNIGMLRLAA